MSATQLYKTRLMVTHKCSFIYILRPNVRKLYIFFLINTRDTDKKDCTYQNIIILRSSIRFKENKEYFFV